MHVEQMGSILFKQKLYPSEDIRQKVNSVKNLLIERGVKQEDVIAILLPRTEMLIVSILALLELEITFVPIGTELPEKRRNYMLKNADVSRILTVAELGSQLLNFSLIYLEQMKLDAEVTNRKFGSEIAYIIYTSGTTGNPKGVEVKREGFENFLEAISKVILVPEEGRISCFTEYTFDIFFLESIWALKEGLTVVLADDLEKKNPKKMLSLIKHHHINMIQITPSRMKLLELLDPQFTFLQEVEVIMLGGEAFPTELLGKLLNYKKLHIYNMYGPTETTIWSMVGDFTNEDMITLGQPIDRTEVYLVTDDFRSISCQGEIGEICIGGVGVARGYRNDEKLTQAHFRYLPFEPYERVYLTGDMGKYDEEGGLIFCGRRDSQIKLNGHRIELKDVENNVLRIAGIQLAVVCYDGQNQRLIAFYLAEREYNQEELYDDMIRFVPDYMIPSRFIRVPELEYTTSGKVDRNALLSKWLYDVEWDYKKEASNRIIRLLQERLKDYDGIIDAETNLYILGLDSLTYVKFLIDVEDSFHIEFDEWVLQLNAFKKLGDLVEYVENIQERREHAEL